MSSHLTRACENGAWVEPAAGWKCASHRWWYAILESNARSWVATLVDSLTTGLSTLGHIDGGARCDRTCELAFTQGIRRCSRFLRTP